MFATGIQQNLQAHHYLRGDFGEESQPHSHPYRVELICRSSSLDENGFSTNIDLLESSLSNALEKIDQVLLNDLPFFKNRQPSLENLCVYIFRSLETKVGDSVQEIEIKIWESPRAWASYIGAPSSAE